MNKIADACLAALLAIVSVVCGGCVIWALSYAYLSGPSVFPVTTPPENISDWIAAMAGVVAALVTSCSFLFLYRTMNMTRNQLKIAEQSHKLAQEALRLQTRPYADITSQKLVSILERPKQSGVYRLLELEFEVRNFGTTPALNVECRFSSVEPEIGRRFGATDDSEPLSQFDKLNNEDLSANKTVAFRVIPAGSLETFKITLGADTWGDPVNRANGTIAPRSIICVVSFNSVVGESFTVKRAYKVFRAPPAPGTSSPQFVLQSM